MITRLTLLFAVSTMLAACTGDLGPPPDAGTTESGCDDDSDCAVGEVCGADGVCVVDCAVGTVSCPCNVDGTCDGVELGCVDGTCQVRDCTPGTLGCGCFADLTCAAGDDDAAVRCDPDFRVCRAVIDDSSSPGAPIGACFTPCTQSLTLPDGTYRACSPAPERLMAGCATGLRCVQGSCVDDDDTPPTCAVPADCPEHQTCMDGGCWSNCARDADCDGGAVCFSRVCRQPCTNTSDSCGDDEECRTFDGAAGVCQARGVPSGQPSTVSEAGFVVTDSAGAISPLGHPSIHFDAQHASSSFRVQNTGGLPLTLTVTKTEETRLDDLGRVVTTTNPLFWLSMGATGSVARQQSFTITLGAGDIENIELSGATNDELATYEGRIVVSAPGLPSTEVWLDYASSPAGQWTGTIHYFIDFEDGGRNPDGSTQIDDWRADKSAEKAEQTKNALLVQWTSFRTQATYSLAKFDALVRATTSGAWENASTQAACDDAFAGNQHCFLFADGSPNEKGVVVYTNNAARVLVPTGVLPMPFAMNITEGGNAGDFVGRIESARALQYPGNPPVALRFGLPVDDCEDPSAAACLVPIDAFASTSLVGGRQVLADGDGCGAGATSLVRTETPWLVPEFLEGTSLSNSAFDSRRYRTECKESRFPFDPAIGAAAVALNTKLADANPIPDGRVRRRDLTLIDGVLVNQERMLLLVQERFSANLGTGNTNADFSAYAIVELNRADIEPAAEDYVPGLSPASTPEPTEQLLATTCSDEVLFDALGSTAAPTASTAGRLARVLINGVDTTAAPAPLPYLDPQNGLHWFCHSTGRFDGGPSSFTTSGLGPEPCPSTSLVTFFRYGTAANTATIKDAACQGASSADRCPDGDCTRGGRAGTCAQTLEALAAATTLAAELNPAHVCRKPGNADVPDLETVNCSRNRSNLLEDKLFYPSTSSVAFLPWRTAVDDAFRYKSRFRARSGQGIGFVPAVCSAQSDIVPYCFDPEAIEQLRARADCMVDLFNRFPAGGNVNDGRMSNADRALLRTTLTESFSIYDEGPDGVPLPVGVPAYDGFERLYAELLVMKGDDALTRAVGSRFDLAGANNASFEGNLLEPDGIVISGGAGFEMNLLYQSMQYDQLALDRFLRLSPTLWQSLDSRDDNLITIDSISTYFNRLILASTKKAAAASEIALRYRSFNRPDLARRVMERQYAQAYLESVTISQFMTRSVQVIDATQKEALALELTRAQQRYASALQKMRDDYQEITDNVTFFGDAPDFISFPQARGTNSDAVEIMLDRARQTVLIAKEREERALTLTRTFDTDAAQFQSELNRVSNDFENELGELCGLFTAADGRVFPAIPKYADLTPVTAVIGNPCGLVGNGAIHDTLGELDGSAIDLRLAVQGIRDLIAEADIEEARAKEECGATFSIASLQFKAQGEIITVQSKIAQLHQQIGAWDKKLALIDRSSKVLSSAVSLSDQVAQQIDACTPSFRGLPNVGVCIANGVGVGLQSAVVAADIAAVGTQVAANLDIEAKQREIAAKEAQVANLERDASYAAALAQCCLDPNPSGQPVRSCENPGPLVINSNARVDTLLLGLQRAELGAERADLTVQLVRGKVSQLRARAQRLIAQQADTEQQLINVQASQNDPTVRILKNSDVLDADKSFRDAQQDAFRATRVYEYYTGQTYAQKGDLFFARLVGRGPNNIENYLIDLERDFRDFEEVFGSPSPRVTIVSLKDDVFRVPRLDATGRAVSAAARSEDFRARLNDTRLLDARGYITIPFSTTLAQTSPLTAIHKIDGVEIEIKGGGGGDFVARTYLTARGTGTIRTLDDSLVFHLFPPLTAVVNPYFGGNKFFQDPAIYRNTRLHDRPFVNSTWELGINQRDEVENADIDLNNLDDVVVYFFYEDFTVVE